MHLLCAKDVVCFTSLTSPFFDLNGCAKVNKNFADILGTREKFVSHQIARFYETVNSEELQIWQESEPPSCFGAELFASNSR